MSNRFPIKGFAIEPAEGDILLDDKKEKPRSTYSKVKELFGGGGGNSSRTQVDIENQLGNESRYEKLEESRKKYLKSKKDQADIEENFQNDEIKGIDNHLKSLIGASKADLKLRDAAYRRSIICGVQPSMEEDESEVVDELLTKWKDTEIVTEDGDRDIINTSWANYDSRNRELRAAELKLKDDLKNNSPMSKIRDEMSKRRDEIRKEAATVCHNMVTVGSSFLLASYATPNRLKCQFRVFLFTASLLCGLVNLFYSLVLGTKYGMIVKKERTKFRNWFQLLEYAYVVLNLVALLSVLIIEEIAIWNLLCAESESE